MNEIDCVVAGDIFIPNLHAKPLERIRRALMYPNPDYRKAMMLKQEPAGIPEWLDCMTETPAGVHVPRGAIGAVKKVLEVCDLKPKFIDRRSFGEPLGTSELNVELRDYQAEAIDKMVKSLQGVVIMPCGGGKTVSLVGALSKIGRSALIILHTKDLFDQWCEVVRAKLGVEPGKIADGEWDLRPVTIAMVDSLSASRVFSSTQESENAGLAKFGVVAIDECHRAPANKYQRLFPILPGRWRIGLTATPDREDGLTKLMYWSFGESIFEIEHKLLVKKGWLIQAEIRYEKTGFEFEYGGPDKKKMAALSKAVAEDEGRNKLIASEVKKVSGGTVLVLSNNKKHCAELGRILSDMGVPSVALMGSKPGRKKKKGGGTEHDPKSGICHTCGQALGAALGEVRWTRKARVDALDKFRSGEIKVLIATALADEGLDIPRLEHVFLAQPGASERVTKQQVGRAMRPFENKKPILHDFIDENVETLVRRVGKRKKIYRELGLI